jgi:uncharacterized membrane protein
VIVLAFIGIMTAQYITWMALESPFLGGVQARYFIPLFPFLAIATAGFRKYTITKNWQMPIVYSILLFPFFTQVILVCQLIARYYLR